MRKATSVLVFALGTGLALAQESNEVRVDAYSVSMDPYAKFGPQYFVFGQGGLTCADTLSAPSHESEGRQWLWGYWSALNFTNIAIGAGAGQERVWIEVKAVCTANPTINLADAALRTFQYFQKNNRALFEHLPASSDKLQR